jgi:hypothetical protein
MTAFPPSVVEQLLAKWEARHDEWRRLHVQVDGAALADEILSDLHQVTRSRALEAVTLKEASALSGYSVDHLQRLVATGQLENVGRKGRPRIRRGDLPSKPGHHLPPDLSGHQFASRRRIVAAATETGTQ